MTTTYEQCHEAAMRASIAFGGPMPDWSALTADEQAWTSFGVDLVRANPGEDFESLYVAVLNQGLVTQTWWQNSPNIYTPDWGTMHKEPVFDALAQEALA